ncbi:enolase C-terminal domain-like protein [Mycolicibacterium sp.]|uniref:enolase C-terminal domain-like protein n=1 Tax=Mycolicibacterium sp. TaxID=2320850 RepID=UPI0037C8CA5D
MRAEGRDAVRARTSGRVDEGVLDLRVTDARIDELRFAMDPPLVLAGDPITTRDYVVAQVTLEGGATGTGYVLTRGQPIGAAAEAVARELPGSTLAELFAVPTHVRGRSPAQRACAIVDICAWDLLGTVHETPVWRLLGEARMHQPALLVAGYRRQGESELNMARRLVAWRGKGYRTIKIAGEADDAYLDRLLVAIRDLAAIEDLNLVLDLGFGSRDVDQVLAAADRWHPAGITWIEDPLPAAAAADIAAVRSNSPIAVAVGDEADPDELAGLRRASAIDVLRADATTLGGLTGLLDIAATADTPLSLHVYPEIHRHVAFVASTDSPIESFPADDPFDFVDRFIHTEDGALVDGGYLPPPSPGLGIRYRPEAVPGNLIRSTLFTAD